MAAAEPEISVCATHRAPSVGPCSRCGAFVCPACKVLAKRPVLCRPCGELQRPLDVRAGRARALARASWLCVFFAIASGAIFRGGHLALLKALLVVLLPLVGLACGVAALLVRRGTQASGVLPGAIVGLALNGLMLAMFLAGVVAAVVVAASR